ncbi:MAG: T9SS type A sorting domain-containing protein [Calditrichaeota bacterium]|nr:T9SS type A sorting domain-containing protein [Calditrichota bacterium]
MTYSVPLRHGWILFSSVCPPANPAFPAVFTDVVARNNLYLVKDQSGRFYRPGVFNNMQPFDVRQGYQAKLNNSDTLVIVNVPVAPDTPIPLREGWNLVAYFPEENLPAPDAFASLDNLVIAKDEQGRFYRPAAGFSNMGSLTRGKGYQVKVDGAGELVYPAGDRIAGILPAMESRQDGGVTHFQPVERTGRNMSVLLNVEWRMENVELEIGAFTEDGHCVGAATIQNPKSKIQNRIGLAVWGDDPTTPEIDGAVEGEALTFKLWDGQTESPIALEHSSTRALEHLTYETDAFLEVSLNTKDSKETEVVPEDYALHEPYPNPFNSTTLIRFDVPPINRGATGDMNRGATGEINLRLFDHLGRMVRNLTPQEVIAAGQRSVVFDAGGLPNGIYFLRLEAEGVSLQRKLALVR